MFSFLRSNFVMLNSSFHCFFSLYSYARFQYNFCITHISVFLYVKSYSEWSSVIFRFQKPNKFIDLHVIRRCFPLPFILFFFYSSPLLYVFSISFHCHPTFFPLSYIHSRIFPFCFLFFLFPFYLSHFFLPEKLASYEAASLMLSTSVLLKR